MKEATLQQFTRAPQGTYVRGRTWLVWSYDAGLGGLVVWAHPTAQDALAMAQALKPDITDVSRPFHMLVEAQDLQGVEPAGFSAVASHIKAHLPSLNTYIKKLAVVLPTGWVGAVVAGLQHVVAPRYPWQTFSNVEDALRFLDDPTAAVAREEVRAIVQAIRAEIPLKGRLEAWLRENMATMKRVPTVAQAALELGVSVRGLQRALEEADTTFRDEVANARSAVAQRMLAETDDKMDAIASLLGFSSSAHFSTQFKRWTGLTPQDYRSRARSGR